MVRASCRSLASASKVILLRLYGRQSSTDRMFLARKMNMGVDSKFRDVVPGHSSADTSLNGYLDNFLMLDFSRTTDAEPTLWALTPDKFKAGCVFKVYVLVYKVHMSRDRIFAAAKVVLDREGIPGLTVRKVAQCARMSPMAMYRHFADKEALLNALMEDGLAAWEKRVRAIRAKDPMDWLVAMSEAYLDFALFEPHRYDAAFFLPAPKARQFPDDFVAGRSPVVALIMVRIDQAKAEGKLGNKPALEMALAFTAFGQGLVSMYRANRFSDDMQFRALYRKAARHLLDSFKPSSRGI